MGEEFYYKKPKIQIDVDNYDIIISIGNRCLTDLVINKRLRREFGSKRGIGFPFGSIPIQPHHILKYVKEIDEGKSLPTGFLEMDEASGIRFGGDYVGRTNKDEVWFGHYMGYGHAPNIPHDDLVESFTRKFKRLQDTMKGKKKVCFLYTSESDVFNYQNSRYNDNYTDLIQLRDYIKKTYPDFKFDMVLIHTNKEYENEENIFNYTIGVHEKFWTDDCISGNRRRFTRPYRWFVTQYIKEIFGF